MAFCTTSLVWEGFPTLLAYVLTPFPPGNVQNRSWCVGWSILNIAWGEGRLEENFTKVCQVSQHL